MRILQLRHFLLLALGMLFGGWNLIWAQGNFVLTYGGGQLDYANRVVRGPGNSYMVGGTTATVTGNNDACLMKLDNNGNLAWLKTYGSTGNDGAWALKRLSDGGYAMSGLTTSFSATGDAYLLRTDAAGNLLWSRVVSSAAYDYGYAVVETQGQGIGLIGRTGASNEDVLITRFDAVGNLVYTKRYDTGLNEFGYAAVQMPDQGFVCAAAHWVALPNPPDNLIFRTNSAGNVVWAYTYGGAGDDQPFEIILGTDGFLYVAGTTSSVGAGNRDLFIMKLATDGTVQWLRTYGGSGVDWAGYSFFKTSDGGFAVCGSTTSFGSTSEDSWLVKTNGNGVLQWSRTYGSLGADISYGLLETAPNEFMLSGNTTSFGASSWDMLLVKTGVNGVTNCNSIAVTPSTSSATLTRTPFTLTASNFGSLVPHATTVTSGSLTRTLGCIVLPMEIAPFSGQRIPHAVQLDWQLELASDEVLLDIERSADGLHFVTIGQQLGRASFSQYSFIDPDPLPTESYYRIRASSPDGSQSTSEIIDIGPSIGDAPRLWPNPSSGTIHLSWSPAPDATTCELIVLDLHGHVVQRFQPDPAAATYSADLEGLPAGCYILQMQCGSLLWREKLVLQTR